MNDLRLPVRREQRRVHALIALGTALVISTASAQYAFDTPPADNRADAGVRYFGSAKDEKGKLLADVTFRLESDTTTFIFVSNADGRFRGTLPLDTPFKAITPKCFKAGLEFVRVTKRPGPKAAKQASVQVDCVLRKARAT